MSDQKNEGEGNKTADKAYREDARDFAESGKVDKAAEKAKDAVEGDEAGELKDAEEKAKQGPDS